MTSRVTLRMCQVTNEIPLFILMDQAFVFKAHIQTQLDTGYVSGPTEQIFQKLPVAFK